MILRANESKNAVSQRGITPKNTMDAVNSVNHMSNLDFIVLDCELLHTPWENTRLGNRGLDKPSAKVAIRWVARLLVLLLALPHAKAKGVALP